MDQSNVKTNEYRYYAFISYKRTDSKWADWLYKKLQSYRLPGRLCRTHEGLPKRLTPVFLDRQDLLPGELGPQLKREIAESKFFISVCSQNAQTRPEYIDMELAYFLETHDNDYTKVIPFIVDDAPNPEKTCFSPRLQALCAEHNIVGINVHEKGKRRAFLKLVAAMHGLSVSEIESADDIRRRKNTLISALISLAVLGGLVFGMVYWWRHYAVHEDYYKGIVWEHNVAKGVEKLEKDELSKLSRYYRIESVDGRVRSIDYLNYAGTLVPLDEEATVLNLGASRVEFTYAGEAGGPLYTAKYFDYNRLPIVCYQFSADGTRVTLLQDEASGIAAYAPADVGDMGMFADRVNVTRYLQELDQKGRVTARFYAYGENYTPMSDGNGSFGYMLSYDEGGRLERLTDFGKASGELPLGGKAYRYDASSTRMTGVTLLDADGEPRLGDDNWAEKRLEWGENHARAAVSYFGKEGEAVLCADGYAEVRFAYDGRALCEESFFDEDGAPILTTHGYARAEYRSNEQGYIVYARYFDLDGKPCTDTENGVYGYELDIKSDTEHTVMYVDAMGKPMDSHEGYAYLDVVSDSFGYPVSNVFRDASGKLRKEPYASWTMAYDPIYHYTTEWRFFDAEGKPAVGHFNSAAILQEYDSKGLMKSITFRDEKGELVDCGYGYAKITASSEQDGTYTVLTEYFYGADGEPVIHRVVQAAGIEYTLTEDGKPAAVFYLDGKGGLMETTGGYAGIVYLYDSFGKVSYTEYVGTDGYPTEVNGYTSVRYSRDEEGRLTTEAFFDMRGGKATSESAGYSYAFYYYDEEGLTAVECFDADDRLIRQTQYGKDGLTTVAEYDGTGNLLREMTYGADDRLVPNAFGVAYSFYEYDESGRLTMAGFFDETFKYTVHSEYGYAAAFLVYGEDGALLQKMLWGAENGELVPIV